MCKVRTTWQHLLAVVIIMLSLAACTAIPNRGELSMSEVPLLWLYEVRKDGESAVLYMKAPGEMAQVTAEQVEPGSHRVHRGNVLVMDDQGALLYAPYRQSPQRLLSGVRPYAYGFVDNGMRVYAVTKSGRLVLRTFGADERILAEEVVQIVPLDDRLFVLTEDDSVHVYDFYGGRETILTDAAALSSTRDGSHILVRRHSATAIIDGEGNVVRELEAVSLGSVDVSASSTEAVYLNDYEPDLGIGILTYVNLSESREAGKPLAERVRNFAWDEDARIIWYVVGEELFRTHIDSLDAPVRVAEDVFGFDHDAASGTIAITTREGGVTLFDASGAPILERTAEGVRQTALYGAGALYATEDGAMYYTDLDDVIALGVVDRWLLDEPHLVTVRHEAIYTYDLSLDRQLLLDTTRPYRYIYYGERLLAESLLRLDDIAGTWVSESDEQLLIQATGRQRGTIAVNGGEPAPFYVLHAAADHLRLMMAGAEERTLDVILRSSDILTVADPLEQEYRRVNTAY